jgi:hypothetical protein
MPKTRSEEPWGEVNETFMHEIIQSCKNKADQHERSGYHFKGKNTTWGLPGVLLPIIMSPVSVLIDSEPNVSKYVNACAFLATGIVAGVASYFKFGEKMANHFNFSARYTDVISDIELELIKAREFRTQLDVFSTRIHMMVDNLSNTEPTIPKFILHDPKYNTHAKKTYNSIATEPDQNLIDIA